MERNLNIKCNKLDFSFYFIRNFKIRLFYFDCQMRINQQSWLIHWFLNIFMNYRGHSIRLSAATDIRESMFSKRV